jgi:tyrosyl-tRNA synthetase
LQEYELKAKSDSPEVSQELKRQLDVIGRGTVEMLPKGEFEERVRESIVENRPLRVKQGFDPTSPDIHLGHTVGLRKLRQFQDLGHQVVLIVGDYTAMVGDPSGRSATRPVLTHDEILKNAETYQKQFFKIVDKSRTEVRHNGEWFRDMDFVTIMNLATKFTVAQIIERDDFDKRIRRGTPISLHELFYPLMQAYDSVAIEADLEIGATEQTFNLLAGRTMQESFGQRPQLVLTMPILIGLDGSQKMSKSLNNYIGVDQPPKEIFGRAMSIPDDLIYSYFELACDVSGEELTRIAAALKDPDVNPMDIKKELAERLVDMYWPPGSGHEARREFERVFSQKKLPDEIPEVGVERLKELGLSPKKLYLVHLIAKTGLAKSGGEARKLIRAGAVSIDGDRVDDENIEFDLDREVVLKVGKRRFLKLLPE